MFVNTNKLKSEIDLKNYIANKLGQGIVRVDITDDQYSAIINDTIQRFYEEIQDGVEEQTLIINIPKSTGMTGINEITLDDTIMSISEMYYADGAPSTNSSIDPFNANYIMADIYRHSINTASTSGTMSLVYVAKTYFEELANMFNRDIAYDFNTFTKKLNINQSLKNDIVLACTVYKAISSTNLYSHQFVKRYSVALAKEQWGTNMLKYNGAVLLGGMEMNGQFYIDSAEKDMEKIEEDIWSKWNEPLGIYVG